MTKSRQTSFFNDKIPKHFGGSFLKGNPKTKRPLSTKHSLHLILKSQYAVGKYSMLQKRNIDAIDRILRKQAKTCGIRIYHLVNVGNHLHLVIKITNRNLYMKYIRSVTGLIARHITHKQRGAATVAVKSTSDKTQKTKFWIARPFTRLIQWGKDFKHVSRYMNKNRRQSIFIAWGFETTNTQDIYLLNTG